MEAGRGGAAVRDRGWEKMREAVAGSEVEGIYGLLRGVTLCSHLLPSQPPMKRSCLAPSSSISQLPSQEPTEPEASDPTGQATASASPAATPAPEANKPAHMQPLRIQMGVPSEYISAGLKVAKRGHQPHGPPSVPTCKRYTWE